MSTKKMKVGDWCIIDWWDSWAQGGRWITQEELENSLITAEPSLIRTAGIIIMESDNGIVIAQSYGFENDTINNQVNNMKGIPKSAIKKCKVIKTE